MTGLLSERGDRVVGGEGAVMVEAEPVSFRAVARQQLPWLYSLARRLDRDRAEDTVQECLLRAYRSFDSG